MACLLLAALIVLVGVPASRHLRGVRPCSVAAMLSTMLFRAGNWRHQDPLDFRPIKALFCLVAASLAVAEGGLSI